MNTKLIFVLTIFGLVNVIATENIYYELLIKTVPGNPDGFPRPVIGVYLANHQSDLQLNPDASASKVYHLDHLSVNMSMSGRFLPEVRPFPGPMLRGRVGDTLHVKVHNMFDSDTTSIHFHGLHMKFNPWMDGVADVTQCGIQPGRSFTYVFNLTQSGTFWYHSHTATQYSDGLVGPIVILPTEPDPILTNWAYTQDHMLMLQDWFHERSSDIVNLYRGPRSIFRHFSPQYPWPTVSLLINGKGLFNCSQANNWNYTTCNYDDTNPCDFERKQCIPLRPPFYGNCHRVRFAEEPIKTFNQSTPFDIDKFTCDPNQNIRLRFINAASNSPLRIWIDRHNLTIVSRDGIDTKPLTVKYLTIPVGQRIDVILTCNQNPKFDYYIFLTVATGFLPKGSVVPHIYSYAYLSYAKINIPLEPVFYPHQHYDNPDFYGDSITSEYNLKSANTLIATPADERIVITYQCSYEIESGYPLESWSVNGEILDMPVLPILQQVKGFKGKTNAKTINLIYGKTYEFVIFSADGAQQHPWHLHGYTLDFVKVGHIDLSNLPSSGFDACGYSMPNASTVDWETILDPIDKPQSVLTVGDSFTVPNSGYVVFRFKADNPGPWMFHCHVNWHMMQGMGTIISVESDGTYAVQPPPQNFPICYPMPQNIGAVTTISTKNLLIISTIASFFVGVLLSLILMACWILVVRYKDRKHNAIRKMTHDETEPFIVSDTDSIATE
jgi:FtsP/CotA-like multicopper oxidase with cupredoxin domain